MKLFYTIVFLCLFQPAAYLQDLQNHWITHQYQFMSSPPMTGKTFGTKGVVLNLGFNGAKFFSEKLVFGITADLKIMPGIIRIYPRGNFQDDMDAAYLTSYPTLQDSANAAVVHSTFLNPGALMGNTIFNWGVMLSLFPQKYGGILLSAKKGSHNFYSHEVFGNPNIEFGAYDKLPISMDASFFELTFKPAAFFRNTYIESNTWRSAEDFFNSLVLTFYYERLHFSSANFNGTDLAEMFSSQFMSKYAIDHRFGFKLGFGFY